MPRRDSVLGLISPLHRRLRTQKLDYFFRVLKPAPHETLLDVGGGLGIAGELGNPYRCFKSVESRQHGLRSHRQKGA